MTGLAWTSLGLAALLPVVLAAHGDGPGPGCTGGFDEPTCTSCHVDAPANGAAGGLRLEGLPSALTPGARYALVVRLSHPGVTRAGFALAARFAEGSARGRQAGSLEAADAGSQVVIGQSSAVQYAVHTAAGSRTSTPGTLTWRLNWTAPHDPAGPVVFHVAGNASNDDNSVLGDAIYVTSAAVRRE